MLLTRHESERYEIFKENYWFKTKGITTVSDFLNLIAGFQPDKKDFRFYLGAIQTSNVMGVQV